MIKGVWPIAVSLTRHYCMLPGRINLPGAAGVPRRRHSGVFLAGLNLPGADLNSEGWPDKFDRIKFEQLTKFA